MKATVTVRGQVTIPKLLRDRLGICPGMVLNFSAEKGLLVVEKADSADVVDQLYGSLGKGRRTRDVLAELSSRVSDTGA